MARIERVLSKGHNWGTLRVILEPINEGHNGGRFMDVVEGGKVYRIYDGAHNVYTFSEL